MVIMGVNVVEESFYVGVLSIYFISRSYRCLNEFNCLSFLLDSNLYQ